MLRDKWTANGALSVQTVALPAGQVEGVRIHLDAASGTSEELVVSIISASGGEYNIVLKAQDMNTLADYVWTPTRPEPYFAGDVVKITWANSNATNYGLELLRKNTG